MKQKKKKRLLTCAGKYKNVWWQKKKKFQDEFSLLRINFVQFSLKRRHFAQSRSSSESGPVPSSPPPRSFALVTHCSSHLQSILWAVTIPVSGGPSSSEAFRKMFSCPFSFHLNVKQRVRKTKKPLFHSSFMILFPQEPFWGSLLFFYFEVEFLHLCLRWGKRRRQKTSGHEHNLISSRQ